MEIRSGRKVGDDLELYYEDLGNPGDPPVLLIMGLARSCCYGATASASASSSRATG
jgi:hypothetical protein